ncbi:LSM12 homolog B [Drosophila takahashii]|uniref:LSM12 homolog B n=1 Tax=Drosophila takahashii TaxID=29030 RepID=UPI001CF83B7D|nr:LOW QUALITY PROTEIN: protein Hezron [Drosophila takahashii]
MSSLAPCFTVGSIVCCKTCFGDSILGEVISFDLGVKMLMMKCPSSKGGGDQQIFYNLTIINLALCIDIEIIKEKLPLEHIQPPEPINIKVLQERFLRAIEHRSISCRSYHPQASPFGQALFRLMVKLFGDPAVKWQTQGDTVGITILHQLIIEPPYGVKNIRLGVWNPKLALYVQRIVQDFHNKQ